jgi:uncharacterized Ntn-hydrolase superfamily protein
VKVDDYSWPLVDLRIDWSEDDPIGELAALWQAYEPQMQAYITRALDPREAPVTEYRAMNNEVQSILATLLAFDTTSRESNLEMIDYINRFLSGFGIECRLFYDDDGKKANLYARLGPPGPGA